MNAVLRHTDLIRRSADLRSRQAGDWGLLFSHPDDFEQAGFERDRWLWLVREAFAAQGVLPLVLASNIDRPRFGWAWSIDPRTCFVGPPPGEPMCFDGVTPLDRGPLPAAMARGESSTRFVAFIDPDGRRASLYEYAEGCRPASLFDLLGLLARVARATWLPPAEVLRSRA